MNNRQTTSAVALLFALAASGAQAEGPQFSAETVQRGASGEAMSGKMFVGDGRMRIEMKAQGQSLVRITDEKRKVEWLLFPDRKIYLERQAEPGQTGPAPSASAAAADPCAGMPGLTCRKLGDEEVGGRPAAKWEIVGSQEGKPVTSLQWIDRERGIPLRQQFPDGGKMELSLRGKETLEGRSVEKWEMILEAPDRQPSHTFQWYDPELKLAVRQEFPGGGISELKNIRIGQPPDDLFVVPAGYSRGTPPAPPAAQGKP